jgi:hypothetical protein
MMLQLAQLGLTTNIMEGMQIYTVFIVQACQTSQYVVPRCGTFLGKWRSSFGGSSDGKMNVQSACSLNTRYKVRIGL